MPNKMDDKALINCVFSNSDSSLFSHQHNAHEIVFVRTGKARFRIGDKTYDVGKNTLVFINNLEAHDITILEEPYCRYFVLFTAEQLNQMIPMPQMRTFVMRHDGMFPHTLQITSDAEAQEIDDIFCKMTQEHNNQQLFCNHYITALFRQLIVLCYRANHSLFTPKVNNINPEVFKLQTFIDANYKEPICIKDICAGYYLSESHLSHAFKTWTGMSIQQYITANRISFAKELLTSTDTNVTDISNQCGFSSVHYFIQIFKRDAGQTPKQYRMQQAHTAFAPKASK